MTRTLQPLSIKGLRSKFAAALEIKENKVEVVLAADDPVRIRVSTSSIAPLSGKSASELQKLADMLGFKLLVYPNQESHSELLISLNGEVTVSFYFDAEEK